MPILFPWIPTAALIAGAVVAAYVVLTYGVGTWAVRAGVKQPRESIFLFSDPAEVPPAVMAEMKPRAEALARLGFEPAGWLRHRNIAGSHIAMWMHRGSGDMAAVLHLAAAGKTWVDFQTEFSAGEQVLTSNLPHHGVFAPHPKYHVARLPHVDDLRALYEMHRRHVALEAPDRASAAVLIPAPGREADWMAEDEVRTYERQRELGMQEILGASYRPTWRGAFRSVVRMAPPTSWIARAAVARGARKLERALHEVRTLPPPRRVVVVGDPAPRIPVPMAALAPGAPGAAVEGAPAPRPEALVRLSRAIRAYEDRSGLLPTLLLVLLLALFIAGPIFLAGPLGITGTGRTLLRVAGVALGLVAFRGYSVHLRRELDRLGLLCPSCRKPLTGTGSHQVTQTGVCQHCGASVISALPAPPVSAAMA